jgi:hypothetical protein
VKKIGSLRNIELMRNGRLVTVLDLYDLLLHGNTSGDQQVMPGDVIFIPPIGNTVSVYGAVRRPAIYELKGEKASSKSSALAGGLLSDADGKLVQLERIRPSNRREMVNIDLTSTPAAPRWWKTATNCESKQSVRLSRTPWCCRATYFAQVLRVPRRPPAQRHRAEFR